MSESSRPWSCAAAVMAFLITSPLADLSAEPSRDRAGAAPRAPVLIVEEAPSEKTLMERVRGSGIELTADRAAELAASSASSVDRANALLDAARAGADRALYGFVPRLDVVASYSRIPANESRFVPNSVTRDIDSVADPAARDLWNQHARVLKDRYSVQSTLTFPVSDYFMELWPRYVSARGIADARQLSVEAERLRVALSAREAYYAYARARAAHAVQKLAVEQAEEAAALVETRSRRGQINRAELLMMRADLASARAALVRSKGGVKVSGAALRSLLGFESDAAIAIDEDLLTALPPSIESAEVLTRRALEARGEARALRAMIVARGHAVAAAEGSRYPSLVLQGQAEVGSPNSQLFIQTRDPQATGYVSVALTWSLGETLSGGPAADEQRAARNQARADLRGLEDAIENQVIEAHVAYDTALLSREAAELSREAARENHRMRLAEFERGRALVAEVLDAVAGLARAEMNLIGAAIDGRVALARLERAVGSREIVPNR